MEDTMTTKRYYADQQAWRDLQQFLPERLRLTEATAPEEDFWDWNGHTIHLDRYRNPAAQARVVLHHGVGTNGRQMSLILGAPLARLGYDVVALDNLGYGMTAVAPGTNPDYGDWVRMVVDFLAAEKRRDPRPIVLYGLSAGGMLTYHVAAAAPQGTLAGIVGMTFLDERVRQVRDETAHDLLTARVGAPFMGLVAGTPLGRIRYPMALASKMSALANDPGAMKVLMKDKTSAANAMSIAFLDSYLNYAPAVEPADFDACPVLLTQPVEDRWSPRHLSTPVLSQITRVPVDEVELANAGHYPLEDPGLQQMVDAIAAFVERTTATRR
jgi:pimeloyl-ACP methyl ester carboxylesterase